MTAFLGDRAAFAEVLRLSTLLTDRVLEAQIRDQPIPEDQVRALTKAASLLQEHGVPWPSMLRQALHEIGRVPDEVRGPPERDGAADDDLSGLARFFAGFRKDRGEA